MDDSEHHWGKNTEEWRLPATPPFTMTKLVYISNPTFYSCIGPPVDRHKKTTYQQTWKATTNPRHVQKSLDKNKTNLRELFLCDRISLFLQELLTI